MRAEQVAQAVALAGLRRLGEAENMVGMRDREPARFERVEHGDGLHQRLAGAAGLRDRDEARGRERQPLAAARRRSRDRDCP